jgi:sugar phosphate isomerase/epimerase
MRIRFFCPRWGSENIQWDEWLDKVKDEGYDGIEWAIANNTSAPEIEKVFTLAEKKRIPVIVQHYETNHSNFQEHFAEYAKWFGKIRGYPLVKINSQTGKDYFSLEENRKLIDLAAGFAQAMRVPIVHETHRGKFSFAAHIAKRYLQLMPDLRITLDASHWVNVAESLLEDQSEAMDLAIERTDHIHARIGHPEGPQVPHPCSKEWEAAFVQHLVWWDAVVEQKRGTGEPLTIAPEFGPFPYMVHHPQTGEPIADQWQINRFMLNFLKQRYAAG